MDGFLVTKTNIVPGIVEHGLGPWLKTLPKRAICVGAGIGAIAILSPVVVIGLAWVMAFGDMNMTIKQPQLRD